MSRAGREVVGLEDGRLLETNFEVVVIQVTSAFGELGFGLTSALENGFTLRDNLEPEQEEVLLWKWLNRQASGIVESYLETSNK